MLKTLLLVIFGIFTRLKICQFSKTCIIWVGWDNPFKSVNTLFQSMLNYCKKLKTSNLVFLKIWHCKAGAFLLGHQVYFITAMHCYHVNSSPWTKPTSKCLLTNIISWVCIWEWPREGANTEITPSYFYRNTLSKNIEADICRKLKNIPRIFWGSSLN